jgi:hypothetical protein
MMACASLDSYEEALQLIRLAQQEMREQARVLINNSGYGDETEYEIYKEAIDDVLEIIGGAEGSKSGDDGKRNISPSSGQPSAESGSFVARKTADDKEKP